MASRILLLGWCLVVLAGCAEGGSGGDAGTLEDAGPLDGAADAGEDAGTLEDAGPSDGAADGGDDAGEDAREDAGEDAGEEAGGDTGDGEECSYAVIHESPGMFFEVSEENPRLLIVPASADRGYRCLRMEFDVEAPDNIDAIADMGLGCPIFLHIGAQSIPEGNRYRAMAAGWFRFRQQGCTPRWGGQLEVAVNGISTGFRGEVNPGHLYHVVIEVDRLEAARLAFHRDGEQVGPLLELPVEGVGRERTQGFRFAFGLDGIGDGAYFPYFGARYFDLVVVADQRP